MTTRKPRPAEATIVGGDIVIRLPIRNIPIAVEGAEERQDEAPMRITDAKAFAKDVVRAMNEEDEDGGTMVHRMLDEAFWKAGDDGAQGAVFGELDELGLPSFPVKP